MIKITQNAIMCKSQPRRNGDEDMEMKGSEMLDQTIDTSSYSRDSHSYCTSTPKRHWKTCKECRIKCFEKHLFGRHIEDWT